MLLTQILATAFVIVGWCITIYVIGVYCYCVVLWVDLDEDKLMDKVCKKCCHLKVMMNNS